MKKFNYLPMAFAAALLAGCSSDDLQLDGQNAKLADDGSQVFVTVNETALTRAGFSDKYNPETGKIKQLFLWDQNDVFKMYKSNTWKPQLLKFNKMATISGVNGAIFDYADPSSKYNDGEASDMENREYAVYPADGLEFVDENRSSLTMTIPATEIDYGTPVKQTAANVYDKKGVEMSDRDGYVYSKAYIPMFGFAVDNSVNFNYMTALLRVNLQSVAPGEHHLTLSSAANKLNGKFSSTVFEAVDYTADKDHLPVFKTEATATDEEKSISVKFTATEAAGADYFIYIPVPVGSYGSTDLSLKLDGKSLTITKQDGSAISEDLELEAGYFLLAVDSTPATETATTLLDINNIIAKYADYGRNVAVDVMLTADIEVPAADNSTLVAAAKKIQLPKLKNNVMLTIKDYDIKGTNTLAIEDLGDAGTGKLTIITGTQMIENPVEATTKQAIGLNGTFKAAVATTQASAVDLVGTFEGTVNVAGAKSVNLGEITLKATSNVIAADEIVADGQIIANNASNRVEITGKATFNKGFNISTLKLSGDEATMAVGQNVDGNKVVYSKKLTLDGKHSSGMLTLMEGCVAEANAEIGNVTVENGAELTINGTVTTGKDKKITTNGGKVTINNTAATLEKLIVNANAEIDLKAGKIAAIEIADKSKATITTAGASEITAVTTTGTGEYDITATWDEATTDAAAAVFGTDDKIYTAAQLKRLLTAKAVNVTLAANVVATDVEWAGSTLFTGGNAEFDGNGKYIDGLKLTGNGFFTASTNGTATIKDFELKNIQNAVADENMPRAILLGYASDGAVTIENVTIAADGVGSAKANHVGGLVAYTLRALTIKNANVTLGTVKGYQFVGGLIGSIDKATTTVDAASKVAITSFDITKKEQADELVAAAGTVGTMVGALTSDAAKFTAASAETAPATVTGYNSAYDQCFFTILGTNKFIFKGIGYVGFSKNAAANAVKIGDVTYDIVDEKSAAATNLIPFEAAK